MLLIINSYSLISIKSVVNNNRFYRNKAVTFTTRTCNINYMLAHLFGVIIISADKQMKPYKIKEPHYKTQVCT